MYPSVQNDKITRKGHLRANANLGLRYLVSRDITLHNCIYYVIVGNSCSRRTMHTAKTQMKILLHVRVMVWFHLQ